MLDLDAVIDGKQGSPRLTDLLKMAEESHTKSGQDGVDGRVLNLLEMQTNKDGTQKVAPTVSNLLTILERDKRWKKVWLNEFSNTNYYKERPLKDTDYTRIKIWMKAHYNAKFTTQAIIESVNYIAEVNGKNPLIDWLGETTWDGVSRMDEWLVRACGAQDTSSLVRLGEGG